MIDDELMKNLKKDSVIIDLKAEFGGNCKYTIPENIFLDEVRNIKIIGYTDYASRCAK